MREPDLPLFKHYPELRARLPRYPLLQGPTPVEPFPLAGFEGGSLFVKRDDQTSATYGGNKPRKLEFWIGHALARGYRRLVTIGALGTNHGTATLLAARQAGLATTLVLAHQPVTRDVQEKLRLFHTLGAEMYYAKSARGVAARLLRVLARGQLNRRDKALYIPPGGSAPRGNVGFVSAAFELAEQIAAGHCPNPSRVFVPVGSVGTLAGLLVGFRLAGVSSRLVGVLVNDIYFPSDPSGVVVRARGLLRFLRRHDPSIPRFKIQAEDFDYITDQIGPGYGSPTPAAREALKLAHEAGVQLELTYTAKALGALRRCAAENSLGDGPTLFWNTYAGTKPNSLAPELVPSDKLPQPFRRFAEMECEE